MPARTGTGVLSCRLQRFSEPFILRLNAAPSILGPQAVETRSVGKFAYTALKTYFSIFNPGINVASELPSSARKVLFQ